MPNSKLPPPSDLELLNRAILESALDCIITMNAAGMVVEFNPAAERVFGFSRAEAVGQELASLIIPPSLRERHRLGLAHYLKYGQGPVLGKRIEIPAIRANGSEILVELAITAFRIAGEPVFTAYLRDITERVRTERRRAAQYTVASILAGSGSLAEAGAEIIQTIAGSGDWVFGSIWVHDEDAQELHCEVTWSANDPKLKTFEQASRAVRFATSEGLPGRVFTSRKPTWIADITKERTFPRATDAERAGLRGAFGFPLAVEGRIKGIAELFSASVIQPDQDLLQMVEALGSQIGLFIHRRQIETELQRQRDAAEAANAAKDKFLATLSHELRTPLTPVLMWAGGTVHDPDLTPDVREGLQMICRNVELEARLIDDLLDLTRITRGKLQLHLQTADAHKLLEHSMDIVRTDISARHITLTVELDAPNHRVLVDAPRLQQVFWNVLRNAYKFTPDHGKVTVHSYNHTPGSITFEISDNGVGIEPEHLHKIFDAFEQVGKRREGLGLGLAISRAVVELHGGTIRAQSAGSGKGATFVIELATAAA
jgi:two-component system cell cycle sensor histidine kinase/response regulator CckA